MRCITLIVACAVIAGCDTSAPSGDGEVDAKGVQASIEPQPILYPDIEKHGIYGASCAFVAEGGGLGAIAIAMAEAGYMKIGGEIIRFEPDNAASEIPLGARESYTSERYAFQLKLEPGEGEQSGYEARNFAARLTLFDGDGGTVYETSGTAQCGV